jgi:hypothetical protein
MVSSNKVVSVIDYAVGQYYATQTFLDTLSSYQSQLINSEDQTQSYDS